jgi:hypothetical protein
VFPARTCGGQAMFAFFCFPLMPTRGRRYPVASEATGSIHFLWENSRIAA